MIRPLLLSLALGASSLAHADLLYAQDPVGPNVGYAWTSQHRLNDGGWLASDDFTLAQGANVQRVTWRGIYLTNNDAGATIDGSPNTDSWTVTFSSDSAGAPGGALFTRTVDAAQVTRTESPDVGYFGNLPVKVYDFSMDLAGGFDVLAGTHYWMSVESTVGPGGWWPLFAWTMGQGDAAATSYQQHLTAAHDADFGTGRAANRAFALYGQTHDLPEPASLALTLLAIAAGIAVRRHAARAG